VCVAIIGCGGVVVGVIIAGSRVADVVVVGVSW